MTCQDRALPLSNFERFDPELAIWEQLPAMPTARSEWLPCAIAVHLYTVCNFVVLYLCIIMSLDNILLSSYQTKRRRLRLRNSQTTFLPWGQVNVAK